MRSHIKYSETALREAVSLSTTLKEVILALGGKVSGGMYSHIRLKIKQFGISTDHFFKPSPRASNAKLHYKEILVHARSILGYRESLPLLRRAMLEAGFEEKCGECGQGPEWNGKHLQLQVDHINGDKVDNREENLRYLCGNCHTQTDNYAGKSKRYRNTCTCGKLIERKSGSCLSCVPRVAALPEYKDKPRFKLPTTEPKAAWPPNEDLKALLWSKPATQVAKELGVTSVAVKKWCNRRGIKTPPRGYWAKVEGAKVQEAKPRLTCSKCEKPISAQSDSGQCQSCYNASEEKREKLRATAAKRRAGE